MTKLFFKTRGDSISSRWCSSTVLIPPARSLFNRGHNFQMNAMSYFYIWDWGNKWNERPSNRQIINNSDRKSFNDSSHCDVLPGICMLVSQKTTRHCWSFFRGLSVFRLNDSSWNTNADNRFEKSEMFINEQMYPCEGGCSASMHQWRLVHYYSPNSQMCSASKRFGWNNAGRHHSGFGGRI